MPTYKLDSQGNYLPFSGYTVICKLNLAEAPDVWRIINNYLLNHHHITDFYSILPCSSWHVTAINLCTQRAVEEEQLQWGAYVASKQAFFHELSEALKHNLIIPVMTYSGLHTQGALQINVVLDNQSADQIDALAQLYHYEDNIPRCFHVTLGYQYKHLDNLQFEALQLELTPLMQAYFKENLKLQPAQLCYFDDMTVFTPWEKAYSHAMFARNSNPIQLDHADELEDSHGHKLSK